MSVMVFFCAANWRSRRIGERRYSPQTIGGERLQLSSGEISEIRLVLKTSCNRTTPHDAPNRDAWGFGVRTHTHAHEHSLTMKWPTKSLSWNWCFALSARAYCHARHGERMTGSRDGTTLLNGHMWLASTHSRSSSLI